MQTKRFFVGAGIVAGMLIVFAALPWYDSDETMQPVMAKYDLEKIAFADQPCEGENGWSVGAVPFGTVGENCHAKFFVFLNRFAFQISGELVPLKK